MVYYDIFETDTTIEYHVSHIKDDVINREAMSRRIQKDHEKALDIVACWEDEAILLGMTCIRGEGSVCDETGAVKL